MLATHIAAVELPECYCLTYYYFPSKFNLSQRKNIPVLPSDASDAEEVESEVRLVSDNNSSLSICRFKIANRFSHPRTIKSNRVVLLLSQITHRRRSERLNAFLTSIRRHF